MDPSLQISQSNNITMRNQQLTVQQLSQIQNLTNCQKIMLQFCQLSNFQQLNLENKSELKHLDLSNNYIQTFSNLSIENCNYLEKLNLSNNYFQFNSELYLNQVDYSNLSSIQKIDLQNNANINILKFFACFFKININQSLSEQVSIFNDLKITIQLENNIKLQDQQKLDVKISSMRLDNKFTNQPFKFVVYQVNIKDKQIWIIQKLQLNLKQIISEKFISFKLKNKCDQNLIIIRIQTNEGNHFWHCKQICNSEQIQYQSVDFNQLSAKIDQNIQFKYHVQNNVQQDHQYNNIINEQSNINTKQNLLQQLDKNQIRQQEIKLNKNISPQLKNELIAEKQILNNSNSYQENSMQLKTDNTTQQQTTVSYNKSQNHNLTQEDQQEQKQDLNNQQYFNIEYVDQDNTSNNYEQHSKRGTHHTEQQMSNDQIKTKYHSNIQNSDSNKQSKLSNNSINQSNLQKINLVNSQNQHQTNIFQQNDVQPTDNLQTQQIQQKIQYQKEKHIFTFQILNKSAQQLQILVKLQIAQITKQLLFYQPTFKLFTKTNTHDYNHQNYQQHQTGFYPAFSILHFDKHSNTQNQIIYQLNIQYNQLDYYSSLFLFVHFDNQICDYFCIENMIGQTNSAQHLKFPYQFNNQQICTYNDIFQINMNNFEQQFSNCNIILKQQQLQIITSNNLISNIFQIKLFIISDFVKNYRQISDLSVVNQLLLVDIELDNSTLYQMFNQILDFQNTQILFKQQFFQIISQEYSQFNTQQQIYNELSNNYLFADINGNILLFYFPERQQLIQFYLQVKYLQNCFNQNEQRITNHVDNIINSDNYFLTEAEFYQFKNQSQVIINQTPHNDQNIQCHKNIKLCITTSINLNKCCYVKLYNQYQQINNVYQKHITKHQQNNALNLKFSESDVTCIAEIVIDQKQYSITKYIQPLQEMNEADFLEKEYEVILNDTEKCYFKINDSFICLLTANYNEIINSFFYSCLNIVQTKKYQEAILTNGYQQFKIYFAKKHDFEPVISFINQCIVAAIQSSKQSNVISHWTK